MTDESSNPGQDDQGNDESNADFKISKEDAAEIKAFIAEQKKLGNSGEEEEEEEKEEDSEDKRSEAEKENESLRKELAELKEGIRQQLLKQLPKKLREKYKEKSLDALGILVDYLEAHSKEAGIPRTPKDEDKEKSKPTDGSIGGKDTRTQEWK